MFDFMQMMKQYGPMQGFQDFNPMQDMQQLNPVKGLLGMTSNQPMDTPEQPQIPEVPAAPASAPFDYKTYDWGLGAPQKPMAMPNREQEDRNKRNMGLMGLGQQFIGLGNKSQPPMQMPMPMPQMQMPQMQQRGAIPMPYSPYAKPLVRR